MSKVVSLYSSETPEESDKVRCVDAKAFKNDIIRPALQAACVWSQAAETLLLGTALAESNLDFVKQLGGGPALSFFQIEPYTYDDVVKYLRRKYALRDNILSACFMDAFPPAQCSTWNIRLACLIARVIYWRRPEPLPDWTDFAGLCDYYLAFYNTPLGAATKDKALPHFQKAVFFSRD